MILHYINEIVRFVISSDINPVYISVIKSPIMHIFLYLTAALIPWNKSMNISLDRLVGL